MSLEIRNTFYNFLIISALPAPPRADSIFSQRQKKKKMSRLKEMDAADWPLIKSCLSAAAAVVVALVVAAAVASCRCARVCRMRSGAHGSHCAPQPPPQLDGGGRTRTQVEPASGGLMGANGGPARSAARTRPA